MPAKPKAKAKPKALKDKAEAPKAAAHPLEAGPCVFHGDVHVSGPPLSLAKCEALHKADKAERIAILCDGQPEVLKFRKPV